MSHRTQSTLIRSAQVALAAFALTACPAETPEPAAPATQPSEPEPQVEESDTIAPAKGEYTCRISIAGEEQPETACRIGEGDLPDSLWFETVDGEVWISGAVTPVSEGSFELAGDLMCPQGACSEPIDATFEETSSGGYEARADTGEGEIVIELTR